ncbi:L,D-transpeptidase family protein [Novosphingobium sp. 9]|uniref:L,D-transpeptidase family protein n=1 Tax=Novosphingobium sp. 9 TaxID=2025349 RepID=UPI0021B51308|nr:L,D-transpeptidase family protein [Novosphingobium sp. 9]
MAGSVLARKVIPALTVTGLVAQPLVAEAATQRQPADLLPQQMSSPEPTATATPKAKSGSAKAAPAAVATPAPIETSKPVVQPLPAPGTPESANGQIVPVVEPVMSWTVADAKALLKLIRGIGSEGLIPADYQPDALNTAIMGGAGDALDQQASRTFGWLIEDLRDGRTPMTDRVQWFAVDPDQDTTPTEQVMAQALSSHDIAGVVSELAPTIPDYQILKDALAATPKAQVAKRALIQANMDRWRWLKRDLGDVYLITNIPEFQLRLTVKNNIIRTYKTVVGKPGRTATPQLAETVTDVVFNPTWTVPQSISKGEGLAAKVAANPNWAKNNGYKLVQNGTGPAWVVQQPGPNNALGMMKIDMPNPHAIYLHDTPAKSYFNAKVRAFSHGCVRTERAVELGMTMAILGAQMDPEKAAEISRSGKYTKVNMTRTFPVYLVYFTYARNIDGTLTQFDDLYGRDKPVLDSFKAPRQLHTTQRASDEAVIKLDNPL